MSLSRLKTLSNNVEFFKAELAKAEKTFNNAEKVFDRATQEVTTAETNFNTAVAEVPSATQEVTTAESDFKAMAAEAVKLSKDTTAVAGSAEIHANLAASYLEIMKMKKNDLTAVQTKVTLAEEAFKKAEEAKEDAEEAFKEADEAKKDAATKVTKAENEFEEAVEEILKELNGWDKLSKTKQDNKRNTLLTNINEYQEGEDAYDYFG